MWLSVADTCRSTSTGRSPRPGPTVTITGSHVVTAPLTSVARNVSEAALEGSILVAVTMNVSSAPLTTTGSATVTLRASVTARRASPRSACTATRNCAGGPATSEATSQAGDVGATL